METGVLAGDERICEKGIVGGGTLTRRSSRSSNRTGKMDIPDRMDIIARHDFQAYGYIQILRRFPGIIGGCGGRCAVSRARCQ